MNEKLLQQKLTEILESIDVIQSELLSIKHELKKEELKPDNPIPHLRIYGIEPSTSIKPRKSAFEIAREHFGDDNLTNEEASFIYEFEKSVRKPIGLNDVIKAVNAYREKNKASTETKNETPVEA